MKLFDLYWENCDTYTEMDYGFVIRAESELRARSIAAQRATRKGCDWSDNHWMDPKQTTCTELSIEGEEEVILVANAGS